MYITLFHVIKTTIQGTKARDKKNYIYSYFDLIYHMDVQKNVRFQLTWPKESGELLLSLGVCRPSVVLELLYKDLLI